MAIAICRRCILGQGIITEEMEYIAKRGRNLEHELIRREVARGARPSSPPTFIPQSGFADAIGIGHEMQNQRQHRQLLPHLQNDEELKKLHTPALRRGHHHGSQHRRRHSGPSAKHHQRFGPFRSAIPRLRSNLASAPSRRSNLRVVLEVIEEQGRGARYMTIHAGVLREHVPCVRKRITAFVRRGPLMAHWMSITNHPKQNS